MKLPMVGTCTKNYKNLRLNCLRWLLQTKFQEERKHELRIKQQCIIITNCRAKHSTFIVKLNENVFFFPSFLSWYDDDEEINFGHILETSIKIGTKMARWTKFVGCCKQSYVKIALPFSNNTWRNRNVKIQQNTLNYIQNIHAAPVYCHSLVVSSSVKPWASIPATYNTYNFNNTYVECNTRKTYNKYIEYNINNRDKNKTIQWIKRNIKKN
jgi:hypothetical protein